VQISNANLGSDVFFSREIMVTNDPKKRESKRGKRILCPHCNFLNPAGTGICKNCRVNIDIASSSIRPPEQSVGLDGRLVEEKEPERIKPNIKKSHKMVVSFKALRVLAWLTFVAVAIGAIGIANKYVNLGRYPIKDVDLTGIGIGIGILMLGVILAIFLLVIASISENLILVRKRLDQILHTGAFILESISKSLKIPSEGNGDKDI
jgi:hypothetical protein